MTDWKTVHSTATEKPSALDTTSSSSTVYERKNIEQETTTDPYTEQEITQWKYEERTYTKQEYELLTGPMMQTIMQNLSDMEVDIMSLSLGEM